MLRKYLGFAAFIATGVGVLVSSFIKAEKVFGQALLIVLAFFYIIGLTMHFKELGEGGK